MTAKEIKEVLFKECHKALIEDLEVSKKYLNNYYDDYRDEYKEKHTKFCTLFRLVADDLELEDEYYEFEKKNGYRYD